MSQYGARSCQGKHPYPSERRALESAKHTQKMVGEPMKPYQCLFCHQWHVGAVAIRSEGEQRTSRDQRRQSYSNKADRLAKAKFQR